MNPSAPKGDLRETLAADADARAYASLPGWLVPALLVGLGVIAGMIAVVGWAVVTPAPSVAIKPVQQVQVCQPIVEAPPPHPIEKVPIAQEETEEPDELPPPPRPSMVLQRRLPAGDTDAAPVEEPKQAASASKVTRLQAPLRWTAEPPDAGAVHVIMPIEVAKIEDAGTAFRVRRLRLDAAAPKSLKLAVTPVVHDDLGSVLTQMGDGYRYTKLRKEHVFSLEKLKEHDVVFLTCADMYVQDFQAAQPLRKFVANGGTLYASDLRGDLLQAAFPEFRAKTPILPGVPQGVEASVVDAGLQSYLGRKTIPLRFDAPDWRPAPFDPAKVTVCLKGAYRNNFGQTSAAPLLVKFPFQKGTVIFTSFHHVKNDSEIVRKLLEYLVFASVNARSENRVKEILKNSAIAAHDMRPALLRDETIEGTFHHAGGCLQFALGFESLGAKVKVTLRSPRGQTIEHTNQSLFVIEVPNAEPGNWRYSVTPLELPYANFPILVAIGTSKS